MPYPKPPGLPTTPINRHGIGTQISRTHRTIAPPPISQPFEYHGLDPRGHVSPKNIIPLQLSSPVQVSVVPFSMYEDIPKLMTAEEMIKQLKRNVEVLEESFSTGNRLLISIHLASCDALVMGVKQYTTQLGVPEFADLFKEA